MIEEEQRGSGASMAEVPVQDRVREIIRSEVARSKPIEASRRPLELIVETSIRYEERDAEVAITVVDETGQPRIRDENGRQIPFAIRDFIAEFRGLHPTLFQADPKAEQPPSPDGVGGIASAEEPAASSVEAPKAVEAPRDWLKVGSAEDDRAKPEPEPTPQSKPTPQSEPTPRSELASRPEPKPQSERVVDPMPQRAPTPLGKMTRPAPPSRFQVIADKGKLIVRRARGRGQAPIADEQPVGAEDGAPAYVSERFRDRFSPKTMSAMIAGLLLLAAGVLLASLFTRSDEPERVARVETKAPQSSTTEPPVTGAVPPNPTVEAKAPPAPTPTPPTSAPPAAIAAAPAPPEAGSLRGVPEVLDTSTLFLQDKVVRLYGVEWARGGSPDDLTRYLKGREVNCRPEGATETYRCQVEGQDLSKVILYNGGARATAEATPDLKTAETRARGEKVGVWRRQLVPDAPTPAAQ